MSTDRKPTKWLHQQAVSFSKIHNDINENHHEKRNDKIVEPQLTNNNFEEDINDNLFQEYKVVNTQTLVGDKTSSHGNSLQGNDINFTDSDAYINKLLNLS